MAELRQNTWSLDEWYDQSVAGTTGGYSSSAGTFFTWGQNGYGTLGYGSGQPYNQPSYATSAPQQIPGTTWKYAKFGYYWGTATRSDGTIWTWGRPDSGVLGHNNHTQYKSPKQVGSDSDWDVCEAGYEHCLALKTNGTLWSWGQGGNQLGLGDNTSRSSPTQIGSSSDWALPIGNSGCMMGVKTDGTLWIWGTNDGGSLGKELPANSHRSSPVQIPGTTWNVCSSGSGQGNFCIRTDGTLWAWGYNTDGQLGVSNKTPQASPVQVPGTGYTDKVTNGGSSFVRKKL